MKKLIALFLAVALCMGLAVPALAAEGYAPFTVDFNGKQPVTTDIILPVYDYTQFKMVPTVCQVQAVEMSIGETVTLNTTAEDMWLFSDILIWDSTNMYYGEMNSCENTMGKGGNSLSVPNPKDYAGHLEGTDTDVANSKYLVEYMVIAKDPASEFSTVQLECYYVILDPAETYAAFTGSDVSEPSTPGEPEQPSEPQDPGNPFTDVAADAYYVDAVKWAVDKGVTAGTSATTFSPDATCTTAQILTFLWRANGSPAPAGSHAVVPVGQYYSDAVNWAYENGLISGSTFNGDTPCTRSATVTYLWKLAGSPAADTAAFTDVAAGSEYAQAVAWAVKEGITAGTSATTFSPDNTCTRGQIVTFLYRDFAE